MFQGWIDKQAHANAGGLQSPDRGLELLALRNDIEAAFGRNFLAFFGDETDFIGHNSQRNIDNLGRVSHFQIQFRHDVLAKPIDIAVLDMPAVAAQMGHNPARARPLAKRRHRDRIGFGIF